MTNPFEQFIQSDSFNLSDLFSLDDPRKATCLMVHPYVKKAMRDYYDKHPINELISGLQGQIAACTAREFLNFISFMIEGADDSDEEILPVMGLTEEDFEAIVGNAVAVAFSAYNAINPSDFDDDETANPQHRE